MVQRNLYLLLAACASFAVLAAPLASAKAVVRSAIFADQVYNVQDQVALTVLFAIGGALAILAIFLYRNRVKAMRSALATKRRITLFALLANVAGLAVAVIYLLQQVRFEQVTLSVGIFLPIVASIFAALAMWSLRKDEQKISSSERLR